MLPRLAPSLFSLACGLLLCAPAAHGQGHTLFDPAPDAGLRPLVTDRPDTTESPRTVDAGRFQAELEALSWTHDHEDGVTADTLNGFALLKAGINDFMDLELVLEPFRHVKLKDGDSDTRETANGFGDTEVRLKVNLWGNDDGATAFALMPFISIPTHRRDLDADRKVEGGIIAPLDADLGGGWSLGTMLVAGAVHDEESGDYAAGFVSSATVSHDIVGDLSGFVEIATFIDTAPGSPGQAYFDAGLLYGLTPDVQLDCGVNVGLTNESDDVRVFVGISVRR